MHIRTGKRVNKKALDRFLLRKRIKLAAVTPSGYNYEECLFLSRFSLINEDKLFISLSSEIVIRLARSMGIKKGKLRLGIYSGIYCEKLLDNMKAAADYIFEIYLYGNRNGRRAKAAEDFFADTGISVVLSEKIKNGQCDILIAEGEKVPVSTYEGGVIRIGGKPFGSICVTGVRMVLPDRLSEEELSDVTVCELYDISPKIRKLIVEKDKN